MSKTQKIVIFAVVAAIVIGIGGFLLYGYLNPEMQISVARPMFSEEDYENKIYFESVGILYGTMFNMPLCSKAEAALSQYNDFLTAYWADMINLYKAPGEITVSIVEQDGKAIITASGWATDLDGNRAEYSRTGVIDWNFYRIVS